MEKNDRPTLLRLRSMQKVTNFQNAFQFWEFQNEAKTNNFCTPTYLYIMAAIIGESIDGYVFPSHNPFNQFLALPSSPIHCLPLPTPASGLFLKCNEGYIAHIRSMLSLSRSSCRHVWITEALFQRFHNKRRVGATKLATGGTYRSLPLTLGGVVLNNNPYPVMEEHLEKHAPRARDREEGWGMFPWTLSYILSSLVEKRVDVVINSTLAVASWKLFMMALPSLPALLATWTGAGLAGNEIYQ